MLTYIHFGEMLKLLDLAQYLSLDFSDFIVDSSVSLEVNAGFGSYSAHLVNNMPEK